MAEIVHAAPPENHPPIDDGWDDKAVEEHIPLSRWQKVKISLGKAADKLYDGAVSTGEKIRDIRYSITFLSIGYLASTDIINDALRAGSEQRAIDVVARLDEVNLKYNGSGPSVDELRYHLDRLRISEDHDKVYREELARYNEWLLSTTPSFRDIANRVRETTDLGRDTRDRFVEEIETALAGMADDTPPIDDEALSLSPDGSN